MKTPGHVFQPALLLLAALLFVFPAASLAQAAPAKPLDPIAAIVDAFKTHDVVALGEGNHGNEQGSAFREKLYRDSRFQAAVNDIVVEAGNGRQQAMMDRYIAGEDVPEKELRMAWLLTTQAHTVWDRDMYRDMFRTIRDINRTLPKARQLRVILADPPFPPEPGSGPMIFDKFPADIVLSEVTAKKRKALIVYGSLHYLRVQAQPQQTPGQLAPARPASIVARLETAGVKVFSINTVPGTVAGGALPSLQADIARWPAPSLTMVKDTPLGLAPFSFYQPNYPGTLQEQFDALLYQGPLSGMTQAPP
ncbi:MAG TPA: hypothetical protein VGO52_25675, partial [Hyphomonadaceae bacterium]|nr:hypothetical protein [Hyphomonadaceae bacterium]